MSVDAPEKNEYPRASSKKIRPNKHDHYNVETFNQILCSAKFLNKFIVISLMKPYHILSTYVFQTVENEIVSNEHASFKFDNITTK